MPPSKYFKEMIARSFIYSIYCKEKSLSIPISSLNVEAFHWVMQLHYEQNMNHSVVSAVSNMSSIRSIHCIIIWHARKSLNTEKLTEKRHENNRAS